MNGFLPLTQRTYTTRLARHSGVSRNPEKPLLDTGLRRCDGACFYPSFRRKNVTPECLNPGTESSKGASNNVVVQIAPLRIHGFDERKFPGAAPFLDCFLASNGRRHRLVWFEPDQGMNTVFLGKTFHEVVLVLPNALNKVGSYARVERAVSATGKDIDAWLLHRISLLDSGLRRNDEPNGLCAYARREHWGRKGEPS